MMTPLNCAVRNDSCDVFDYLVKQNANANIADVDGNTPLHSVLFKYIICCNQNTNPDERCTYEYATHKIIKDPLVGIKSNCYNLVVAVQLIEYANAD
ncbi:hypothetical protein B4U80_14511 [Leptotrombidium deliense]|uniref:Uncharacterized protein n=1 Tax=Leptotrombidium deliense TaxID=299467 RepID=A0A443RVH8_9ACAR|nr:hypothetical protein B4U80_14511 [Leptotrombidium deliense]